MYKKAFTLAETLLTLAIIGVVAALTVASFNKLNPDKTKIMYLKASKVLSKSIKTLASNTTLYPVSNANSPILGNETYYFINILCLI